MPVRGIIGTDYIKIRPDFRVITNPFGDDEIVLVPPIEPEVALIHAFKADREGNVLVDKLENDPLLVRASKYVFVSCEEMVQTKEELSCSGGVLIPSLYITGIIMMKGGASPTRCGDYYDLDDEKINLYLKAAQTEEGFKKYLKNFLQD
jgi:glutaconate CoA-transferase subunit A